MKRLSGVLAAILIAVAFLISPAGVKPVGAGGCTWGLNYSQQRDYYVFDYRINNGTYASFKMYQWNQSAPCYKTQYNYVQWIQDYQPANNYIHVEIASHNPFGGEWTCKGVYLQSNYAWYNSLWTPIFDRTGPSGFNFDNGNYYCGQNGLSTVQSASFSNPNEIGFHIYYQDF
jgi:hypothetical protein